MVVLMANNSEVGFVFFLSLSVMPWTNKKLQNKK